MRNDEERGLDKKVILLVDTDEEYVSERACMLLEEFEDEAEIEVITQLRYFKEYFSCLREIYMLIIDEILYSYEDQIKKQDIQHIFLLEDYNEQITNVAQHYDNNCKRIKRKFKTSELREQLVYSDEATTLIGDKPRKTELIFVCSAAGGTGKTVTSLGCCSLLAESGKKTLYINMEEMQDFIVYLQNTEYMTECFEESISHGDEQFILHLSEGIQKSNFDYMKPIQKSSHTSQITSEAYIRFLERMKETQLYDRIVFETSEKEGRVLESFFKLSDKVIMVCLQDKSFWKKLQLFLKRLTFPYEKSIFVCNRYREDFKTYFDESLIVDHNLPYMKIEEHSCSFHVDVIKEDKFFKQIVQFL